MYDLPFNVKYNYFEPSYQLETYVRHWLYNIIEYCPYDSFVNLSVTSLRDMFIADLKVTYIYDQFSGTGEDATIENALLLAEEALYLQIKNWRSVRYLPHPMESRAAR